MINPIKLSGYGYIFNATLYKFDIEKTIDNFCAFFEEFILVTCPSKDNTREILSALEKKHKNLKVVDTEIDVYKTNRFDGQLKTIGMNQCQNQVRVIADCDEKFALSNRWAWNKYGLDLLEDRVDCYLVPVIDLFGSEDLVRSSYATGQKFRMTKPSVVKRGVPNFAERKNGLFDTKQSDDTEPLLSDGSLCSFRSIVDEHELDCKNTFTLNRYPNVLHFGAVSFERRIDINANFWLKSWEARSGGKEDVITDIERLKKEPTIKHNVALK